MKNPLKKYKQTIKLSLVKEDKIKVVIDFYHAW